LHQSAIVIPIHPDGRPQFEARAIGMALEGCVVDVSLEFCFLATPLTGDLMLGIESTPCSLAWIGVTVAQLAQPLPDRTQVLCRFGGRGQALLRAQNLTAHFDDKALRYVLDFPDDVLNAWARLGVLHYRSLGEVATCPTCGSIPAFRVGCPGCGCSLLATAWLLHHRRCGHSGLVDDWRGQRMLRCPGCERFGLACGSEFLCQEGHRCGACGWAGTELGTFGHCRRCWNSFPADRAVQRDIPGYDVCRFDPTAARVEA